MRNLLIFLSCVFLSSAAFALTLDQAKASGAVGERADGYLGLVKPDAQAEELTRSINRQRRDAYSAIAAQTGQDLTTVEKLAAEKAFKLTPPGQYIQESGGSWRQK